MDKATIKHAIDVGANDGGYTHTLVEHGFSVTAIEPVPDMFTKMQARFVNDDRVKCLNVAAGDKPGRLNGVTVLECWTIGQPKHRTLKVCPSYKGTPTFDVDVITLDSLTLPIGVGIIKLDVDGYEKRVLEGARELIGRWHPPILCELSKYIADVGDDIQQFVELIFSLGYTIVTMDGKRSYSKWKDVSPHYPKASSFDVMLMPKP